MADPDPATRQLTQGLLAAESRILSLEADVVLYRELLQAALAQLHTATAKLSDLTAQLRFYLTGEPMVRRAHVELWRPPADAPEPPHDMVRAGEMRWTLG